MSSVLGEAEEPLRRVRHIPSGHTAESMQAAAREILEHIGDGGRVFEDFSYKGARGLVKRFGRTRPQGSPSGGDATAIRCPVAYGDGCRRPAALAAGGAAALTASREPEMPRRPVVDPRFGSRMRAIREDRGLSLRSLERRTLSSKSQLHKIETGRAVPSVETAGLIDDALDAGGELAAMVHRPASTVLPRREFLEVAAGVGVAPMVQHLTAGRRIGPEVVEQSLLNTARLRRLDDFVGGADTYRIFADEVASTTRLLREGSYLEATGRRLSSLLAEQAQLAGWAAFDAGWYAEAHQMYSLSLQAARDADDPALAGNAMAFIGYQALAMGRSAVDDLIAACDTASRDSTPGVRTLLHCRRAWAHANEGQASEAQQHLDRAMTALREPIARAEPDWVYWVNDLEHEIMTGRCWVALRRPFRAITALESVARLYDDTHGRDKALYLSFLADAYLDANELERSCEVASRAMDLSAGVGSVRPQQRVEAVLRRMDGSAQCVVELRARAAEWASLRRLSASPTPDTEPIPPQSALR